MGNFIFILIAFLFVAYLIYGFFIVYHMRRFGIGAIPWMLSVVFIAGSILIMAFVLINANSVDWQKVETSIKGFKLFSPTR